MVASGHGIPVLPKSALSYQSQSDRVMASPIKNPPRRRAALAWHRSASAGGASANCGRRPHGQADLLAS
ncbi:MAG TPA: hypothetical protein PLB25_16075 [Rhodoferax sp.]|nr:hypothetical protein [Rhodoferax sp.]